MENEQRDKLLKQLFDHFNGEDKAVRDRQIRTWRRLKFLWDNLQHHYYSEVAHDWRLPDHDRIDDQSYYDKPVNVFRAYLESIIAALSITVPPITCFPDDADNPLDVTTARAGDKIAELLFKHNDAPLLWLHALFIFCTEGMLASYTYPKEDEKFGTYEVKKYEEVEEIQSQQICPVCNQLLADKADEFMPEGEDYCPLCGNLMSPTTQEASVTVTRMVGVTNHPKSRIMMDVFGGLYVKVPVYARKQSDCPYLIFSYETHYSNVLQEYPKLRETLKGGKGYDSYEQWGRLSPQYRGEYPINNVTIRYCWFRPSAYNILCEEDAAILAKEFPQGVKVVIVNDTVADSEGECLDDYWTLSYNPLSDYIHFDPLGLLLTSVQEITNDIISLVLQTIEHGIPQTFASPKVLDFNAYRQQEVIPGGIYPANSLSGRPISEGFYEVKTATLSGEVLPFANKVQEIGQLVSGALPSLFGGQVSGSRTASEYSMSRAQALQRLQTTWKTLIIWWKNSFGKAIPMFIKEMQDDERNVTKDNMGNFINVFIRKSELMGKIGSVELEANENLPLTWSQQKDAIMQLVELNNPDILQGLFTPENMPFLRKAIGVPEYNIQGEDDKNKQYEEIVQLVDSEPFVVPSIDPMTGMPTEQEIATVEIDQDIDDHNIHAEICRKWLIGEPGRLARVENPQGYKNVLLHMKMHKDAIMAAMMQQSAMQQQQQMQQEQAPNQENNNGE